MRQFTSIQIIVGIEESKEGETMAPTFVSDRLNQIRTYLANEIGGYTEQDSYGGWINPSQPNVLVQEKGKVFTLITNTPCKLYEWAGVVRDLLHQNSVVVIYADKAEFI